MVTSRAFVINENEPAMLHSVAVRLWQCYKCYIGPQRQRIVLIRDEYVAPRRCIGKMVNGLS